MTDQTTNAAIHVVPLPGEPVEWLRDARIAVTGGAGFLGRHVVATLNSRGYRHVTIPRSAQYDLRLEDGVARFYAEIGRAHV